jgi:hypothetical protein
MTAASAAPGQPFTVLIPIRRVLETLRAGSTPDRYRFTFLL